jgi:hypothetical protein
MDGLLFEFVQVRLFIVGSATVMLMYGQDVLSLGVDGMLICTHV